MPKPVLVGTAWLASLVLAWFLGAAMSEPPAVRMDAAGAREAGAARGEAGAGGGRDAPPARDRVPPPSGSGRLPQDAAGPAPAAEPDEPFTLDGADTLEELSRRMMRYADRKLRQGPEGHRELFKILDRLTRDESLHRLFEDEAAGARLLYPWARFLVDRDRQVIAMMETLYQTAAEDPAWFEGTDDDTLEIFSEGLAFLLPGAVDDATLGRFRGYAHKILAMDRETLPKALGSNFGELRRNLEHWAPAMAPAETLERLRDPNLPISTRVQLLKRAGPEALEGVDVVSILRQALEQGDGTVVRILGRVPLGARDVAVLDQAFTDALAKGSYPWAVYSYLRSTGRAKWADARPFVEDGLARGGKATEAFARALMWLRPDADSVRGILERYDLSEQTRTMLESRFGIK
ncbi:MAG: hypothetical protein ACE5JG_12410 [Planctomycetota bacterium]